MEPTSILPQDREEDDLTIGIRLFRQQDYAGATRRLRIALETCERTLIANHRQTLACRFWLGRSLYKQTQYGEACWVLQQAVNGLHWDEKSKNPELALEYHFWLGRALLANDDRFSANLELQQVLKDQEDVFGRNDQRTVDSRFWYGKLLYIDGDYREAEWVLRLAMEGQESLLGQDHEYTLCSKSYFAFVLDKKKEYSEAQVLLQQVKEGVERTRCNESEWTRSVERLLTEYRQRELASSTPKESNPKEHALSNKLDSAIFSGDPDTREPYTDAQIQKVTLLLRHFKPQWSKVPRTYILLRTINQLSLMDQLIDDGFTDYMFPVNESPVPKYVRPNIWAALRKYQRLILTKSMDLEKGEEGGHCHFGKGDSLPFEELRRLGKGGYGEVHLVRSLLSFKEYARKRVARALAFSGRGTDTVKEFIAEIQILTRLKHHHIVQFVGSYTDPRYIGLLMSPVARTDLSIFMRNATDADHVALRTYFGCLAKALEFLHSQQIRHKDIKPTNILIDYSGNVLFTDFGLSLDFTDASGSTTTGMTRAGTPKYSSPEAANFEPRNTKSDIWSLGIVFLEIAVTLKGRNVECIDTFFSEHGSLRIAISGNIDSLPVFMAELQAIGNGPDNKPLSWIGEMLKVDQRLRPTASVLVELITGSGQDEEKRVFCCDECLYGEEDFPE